MSQTLEQIILELRRSLPEEFLFNKAALMFFAPRVSMSIKSEPWRIVVRQVGKYPPRRVVNQSFQVRKDGTVNVQAAVKLALEHFNRPELAEECAKRKEAKSKKLVAKERAIKNLLMGMGIPIECFSEQGRRGLQISATSEKIDMRITLTTSSQARRVLEALPKW